MIVIIDYGMGNAISILNMIRRVGGDATISSEYSMIAEATALILPGVGSFDNAIEQLRKSDLERIIKQRILNDKVPILGICLGMQLLFNSSEEGSQSGLGLIITAPFRGFLVTLRHLRGHGDQLGAEVMSDSYVPRSKKMRCNVHSV